MEKTKDKIAHYNPNFNKTLYEKNAIGFVNTLYNSILFPWFYLPVVYDVETSFGSMAKQTFFYKRKVLFGIAYNQIEQK